MRQVASGDGHISPSQVPGAPSLRLFSAARVGDDIVLIGNAENHLPMSHNGPINSFQRIQN